MVCGLLAATRLSIRVSCGQSRLPRASKKDRRSNVMHLDIDRLVRMSATIVFTAHARASNVTVGDAGNCITGARLVIPTVPRHTRITLMNVFTLDIGPI